MKARKLLLAAAVSAALLATVSIQPAWAALSASASQNIGLTVGAACTVVAPANINFGTVVIGATPTDITTTLTTDCTATSQLAADSGLWSTNTTDRRMRAATTTTEFVTYTINAPDATVLGSAGLTNNPVFVNPNTNSAYTVPANQTSVVLTIKVPAAIPGTAVNEAYSDTVKYYVNF